LGRRSDNPSISQFGYNDNTIRRTKIFKPIKNGNSQDNPETIQMKLCHVDQNNGKTK